MAIVSAAVLNLSKGVIVSLIPTPKNWLIQKTSDSMVKLFQIYSSNKK